MPQCVTAEQIAEAFISLMQADQQSFLVLLVAVVAVVAFPGLLHRWIDYRESRKVV